MTGKLREAITRITVSPEGRIAYAREVAKGHDTSSFAGVLDPGREWPARTRGLYWRDAHTLGLPEDVLHETGARDSAGQLTVTTREAVIDVRLPAADPRATSERVAAPRGLPGYDRVVPLPDGRTLRALGSEAAKVTVHDGDRPMGAALTLGGGGRIESMALAPGGDHLLVSTSVQVSPPSEESPSGTSTYELVRVDLRPVTGRAVTGEGDLGLPRTVVWRGSEHVGELAW
ncbi:hypothetical protein [Nonomuraea sp. LPB2021202275-12-8]|uniref:hypothetical protein n=1 Tax=Nonomuraea sp. LPB2021202275-12-8 TaxID=3120159 RepID=UPI00300D5A57